MTGDGIRGIEHYLATMEGRAITCPACEMTSYHPTDVEQGYCGNCHDFTSEPWHTRYQKMQRALDGDL